MRLSAAALLFCIPAAYAASPVFVENFGKIGPDGVPAGWQFVNSPAPHALKAAPAPNGFRMTGGGDPYAKGRIVREIKGLQTGQWYRFEVSYTTSGEVEPHNNAQAVVQWITNRKIRSLTPEGNPVPGKPVRSTLIMKVPEETKGTVNLHLFAGFIPKGTIEWREVKVEPVPDYQPPKRPVTVAVIDSQPPKEGPVLDNARHYAAEIDKACAGGKVDIVLLPENYNRTNSTGKYAVSLDSEYMKLIAEAARRNNVYVTGSIREERDGAQFNAAVLLDRKGKVAGYYRKSHLTVGEMVFSEIARGDEFKLFETDFGKVGVLICWDFHFPEAARILALRGAELVLVPMASDGRVEDDGRQRGAEHSGKAFVLENRIPVVFAATLGSTKQPSLIIDQQAKILARSTSENHIIRASLDLEAPAIQWSGDDFRSQYKVGRRPELYKELGKLE